MNAAELVSALDLNREPDAASPEWPLFMGRMLGRADVQTLDALAARMVNTTGERWTVAMLRQIGAALHEVGVAFTSDLLADDACFKAWCCEHGLQPEKDHQ